VRASVAKNELAARPGEHFSLELEVANTSEVIDAVLVSLRGLPGARLIKRPSELALFPGTSGKQALRVELPPNFPAGRHDAAVDVRSAVNPDDAACCGLVLQVPPVTDARVSLTPLVRRGHRNGRFAVLCHNTGNTDIDVSLQAADPERSLRFRCEPAGLVVEPGSSAQATLSLRAPRQIFGSERARPVQLSAKVRPLGVPDGRTLDISAQATYVQRPTVPRGVVTACILAAIVALWSGIFLLGVRSVLAEQPLTKSAPLSFFALQSPRNAQPGAQAARLAGFAPKSFAPLGVAGSVEGKVTSPGQAGGIGGVTVQAIATEPGGGPSSSASTGPDGSFEIAGLFPGEYKIFFSAPGFRPTWYGGAGTERAAKEVEVGAGTTIDNIGAAMSGMPGSLTGEVVTGEVPPPRVRVVLRPVHTGTAGPKRASTTGSLGEKATTAGPSGTYSFAHLRSPAAYWLDFEASGFTPLSEQVFIGAGQRVVANVVQLQAKPGGFEGYVEDGGRPLGGVKVIATGNGHTFVASTPTVGHVGEFSLLGLPTPATYVLSFSAPGLSSYSSIFDLGPGEMLSRLHILMVGGAGAISGRVTSPNGRPLGGVTVTVGGLPTQVEALTLTAGLVGSYDLTGLPTPGTFALTFSLTGYISDTIAVTLGPRASAHGVDVSLRPALGAIVGAVDDAKSHSGLAGVRVTFTDGSHVMQTYTGSAGHYLLAQLAPGAYTGTFYTAGYQAQTVLVHLGAGQDVTVDVPLQRLVPRVTK
jgi:hypothetical protein